MKQASCRVVVLVWAVMGLAPAVAQDVDAETGLVAARAAAEQARTAAADPGREIGAVVLEFEKAAKLYEAFIKENPNDPGTLGELGKLLQAEIGFLGARSETGEALFAAAKRASGRAVECFRRVAEIHRSNTGTTPDADADWGRRTAQFHEALCHYQLARVLAAGDPAWHAEAEKAITKLDDFLWDNEENILGGYACLYRGLCLGMLDRPDEAVEWLRNTCGYSVPPAGDENYGKWTDLVLQAHFKLGEICNGVGKRGEKDYREIAIREIGKMPGRIPDAHDRRFGQLAVLERAKAQLAVGDRTEAFAVVLSLGRSTKLPDIAYLADRWLSEAVESTGLADMTPETLYRVAMAKKRERKWEAATLYFFASSNRCEAEEDVRKWGIPARREIGECLYRQEKFKEAYDAYLELIELCREKAPDTAADAAYYAYRSATALAQKTRTKEDRELKRAARMRFASEFSDYPRAVDLMYYEGADRVSDGDAKLASGEEAAARKRYESAISLFRRARPSSKLFEKARARIGEVHYKLSEYAQALKAFADLERTLDAPGAMTTDHERLANRAIARALADYYTALCHMKQRQWRLVVERLEGFERRHTGPESRAFLVPARFERARALTRLGRLREAEIEVLRLAAVDRGRDSERLEALLLDLTEADPSRRLTHSWWRWELLLFRNWLVRLEHGGDEDVAETIQFRYRRLEKEGVLENSPFREQLREIYDKASEVR